MPFRYQFENQRLTSETDRNEVLRRFGPVARGKQNAPAETSIRIVTLLPLDRGRVERFSRQRGVVTWQDG